jgi:hypothetical protein
VNTLEGGKFFKLQVYIIYIYTGVELIKQKKQALYFITKNSHSIMFKEAFGVGGENRPKRKEGKACSLSKIRII